MPRLQPSSLSEIISAKSRLENSMRASSSFVISSSSKSGKFIGPGLPHFRFHDLRHTCATLLLTQNVNTKVASEMLGHSSIAITLDTYSYVLPNMQDSAARALEEALI